MIFDKYPYTNFHELNDDWIIQTLRQFDKKLDEFVAMNSLTYADPIEYDPSVPYAANTVVIYVDAAYVSKQQIPAGILPTNGDYWLIIFPFGDLIDRLIDEGVDAMERSIDTYIANADARLEDAISGVPAEVDAWLAAHPDATTTVLPGSIAFRHLLTSLQNVILDGYTADENAQTFDNTDFTQGYIFFQTGAEIASTSACRTDFLTFPDSIIIFASLNNYISEIFEYDSDGTYLYNSTGANGPMKAAFSVKADHKYRVTVKTLDGSTMTPADIPFGAIMYQLFIPNLTDLETTVDNLDTTFRTGFGEVVIQNFTKPTSGNAVVNFEFPVRAGEEIQVYWDTVTPNEQGSLNLYSRLTRTGANVETLLNGSRPREYTYKVVPTQDANWLRVSANKSGTIYVYKAGMFAEDAPETPFVKFDFNPAMYDPSDILTSGGEIGPINEWTSKSEALSKVHAAFDALCAGAGAGYGSRIYSQSSGTKLYKELAADNALFNLIAPDYVTTGVTLGQSKTINIGTDSSNNPVTYSYTYESTTPPYDVRLYRFQDTNSALHTNTRNVPKKKLLLVGGTHGNEFCAPIDLYIFAKHLCTDYTNPDIIKLRSAFDIYIIPYLNGFGCLYQWNNNVTTVTGARSNGNMVDINRNCYTAGWSGLSGTSAQITSSFESHIANLATNTFAGPSNGSEFEAQLLKAVIEYLKPDVFIDHHHNTGNAPFYATCRGSYAGNLIYQAANDTAYGRMLNMPEYFGSQYNLFLGSDVSPATPTAANGHTVTMAYELGIKMSAVNEMPDAIAYLSGVINNEVKAATKYSADAFKQAEYTLLNVMLHLCQYAMEH